MVSENTIPDPDDTTEKVEKIGFPCIACLGSSAGGLQALEAFFAGTIASGQPLCFVLVMHMSSNHESLMSEILARYTNLRILEVASGMSPEADHIYIVPGNRELSLNDGVFLLSEDRSKAPIDFFLKSLAIDQGSRAIAVILSGAARDGTEGIQHIRKRGGLVVIQDPETAQQASMPQSAIESRAVDLILPPGQMLRHILKWVLNPDKPFEDRSAHFRGDSAFDLQRILYLLKASSGHDFTLYKKNTIKRRLEKRMAIQGIESLVDYVRFLENDPAEKAALLREILIGVTSFFRDPEAFECLKDVVQHLIKDVGAENSLRIWVPGCSTGQEAYSIAIVILESIQQTSWDFDLKIFASDIDKEAVEFAREGKYPFSIAEEMSEERLRNFFIQSPSGFQIKKEVKDKIIFAHHNVTRDPPFSKLDLISCRNLMIYMEPVLQQKVLRIFHYSLNPEGILFLGNSETVGESSPMFGIYDKKWKFFERKNVSTSSHRRVDFESFRDLALAVPESTPVAPAVPRKLAIREISQDILMQEFVPPTIVCDELGEIVYIHGKTGRYLEPSPGEARLNIFSMAREDIKLELSRGFQKVIATAQNVRYADLKIKRDSEVTGLDITLRLVNRVAYPGRVIVVTFEEGSSEPVMPENTISIDHAEFDERSMEIERELLFTREHMQSLVEQLETSNEELKSMNEELQSSNEELQSSNEELETAKEELQAVNEELVTLNAELQEKIEELSTANSDLDNFLSSSSIATIFLDRRFYITRYSRSTGKIFNLIPSDIGRSLGDIASQVKYEGVLKDAEEVLESLSVVERMVELKDGRWLSMRITPYKTANNFIDGVVIGFSDISEQRRLENLTEFFEAVMDECPTPLMILEKAGRIVYANEPFLRILGYKESEKDDLTLPMLACTHQGQAMDFTDEKLWDWSGTIEVLTKSRHPIQKDIRIMAHKNASQLLCIFIQP